MRRRGAVRDRPRVFLVGLLVLLSGLAFGSGGVPAGEEEPTAFRETLFVSEEDYFFVQGRRLRGAVECLWTEGEPFTIGACEVFPPPARPFLSSWSDEQMRELFGKVPLVQALVDSGYDLREAARISEERRKEAGIRAASAYTKIRRGGATKPGAARASENVKLSLGHDTSMARPLSRAATSLWGGPFSLERGKRG